MKLKNLLTKIAKTILIGSIALTLSSCGKKQGKVSEKQIKKYLIENKCADPKWYERADVWKIVEADLDDDPENEIIAYCESPVANPYSEMKSAEINIFDITEGKLERVATESIRGVKKAQINVTDTNKDGREEVLINIYDRHDKLHDINIYYRGKFIINPEIEDNDRY